MGTTKTLIRVITVISIVTGDKTQLSSTSRPTTKVLVNLKVIILEKGKIQSHMNKQKNTRT